MIRRVQILEQPRRWATLRNRPLLTLMLGHFTVDSYVGVLPVLYPLLMQRFELNFRTVGLVSLAYTGTSSLSQPIFGWIADRYGTRWIGLALVWTATIFALVGFAPSFEVLLVLAAAAGLGSGAYHPFGALSARAVIPPHLRNTSMAIYTSGGTLGVAIGPLIGALIFAFVGIRGTSVLIIPGVCIALWMLRELGQARLSTARSRTDQGPQPRVHVLPLLAVIGVMMSRNWTVISLETFIPSWYATLGYGASFYSALATTVVLASAAGTIGSGTLADRWGGRTIIIASLVLTIPALLLFAQFPGPWAFLSGALVGLSAASTAPLMLIMAQQLMAGRAGVASGLILGLGFITGAIGVPITGMVADAFGMGNAMSAQALLVIATIPLAFLLPTEARLRSLNEPLAAEAP